MKELEKILGQLTSERNEINYKIQAIRLSLEIVKEQYKPLPKPPKQ